MPNFSCEVKPEEPNKPPHIAWKTDTNSAGYKLIELAQPNGFTHDLPGRERIVDFYSLLKVNNNLLFSEFSGGRMDFVHDYQQFLSKQECPWLYVKANSWNADSFIYSPDFENKATGLLRLILRLGQPKLGISDKIHELLIWLKANSKQQVALIFRDISVLGPEQAKEITGVLRQVYDGNPIANKLSITILDTSSWMFLDALEASGYAPLCYQYRLPFLCELEIKKLFQHSLGSATIDDDALNQIFDQTGGQLLIVQDCLRRLSPDGHNPITRKAVNRAVKNIHNNPPTVVNQWQNELAAILNHNPELIISLAAYVEGHSLSPERFPPPSQERPLFLAGWLKLNRLGRWGITSSLHASLANDVLNGFAKIKESKGVGNG